MLSNETDDHAAELVYLLRHAEFKHITLAPTNDGRFVASVRQPGSVGYSCDHGADPVEALLNALRPTDLQADPTHEIVVTKHGVAVTAPVEPDGSEFI